MQHRHLSPITPAADHPAAMPWTTVRLDAGTGVCGVLGQGSPLVFVPGGGSTPLTYRHALERLARRFRVYAPLIPGFAGVAGRPLDRRTLRDCSAWLGRFLDAADLGPVTLVGHSFGGAIAIQTADADPDRVARLVLVNSVGGGPWPEIRSAGSQLGDRKSLPLRMRATTVLPRHTATICNSVRDPRPIRPSAPVTSGGYLVPELNRIAGGDLPVSLLWSRGDRLVTRARLEALRGSLGRPPVFTVAGGHDWPITAPDYFGNAMRTVLDWLPTRGEQ